MKLSAGLLSIIGVLLFSSCQEKEKALPTITVSNTLDFDRANETVTVPYKDISLDYQKVEDIVLIDKNSDVEVIFQDIDSDGDGNTDAILFQPKVAAKSKKEYEIRRIQKNPTLKSDSTVPACYSRFVPERTDDYAWENNKVAFRTYGPTAQKMKEEGVKGGTLSSGIDAWLKRVDYPIINKWYKKELETDGSYHKDDGEGLDNFHVGVSRGVGGLAKKMDSSYHFSKNFVSWKTLSTGPIRTSFILTYADWDANGSTISEQKLISLDYGSNLSRFEISIKGTDTISAGLTLHEKDGEIEVHENNTWVSYWQPHEDSELGTAIVVPSKYWSGYEHYLTEKKDESNLFAHLNIIDGKAIYYAGFGWKKSGQFKNKDEWEAYVDRFSECLENPLQVDIH